MEVKAKLRNLRIAPRKVRLVADIVRNQTATEATTALRFVVNKPSKPLLKLLNSAIANAENNHGLKKENLFISEIRVDEGVTLKRWMPRARGSASSIEKKTSHISLSLREIKETSEKKKTQKRKSIKIKKVDDIKDLSIDMKSKEKRSEKDLSKGLSEKSVSKKIFRRKSI